MEKIIVKAPLSGMIYPIEQVPDPVFAQKMVGDGISIDPVTNVLTAPVDGQITQLHSASHAVTVTHSSGLEVMMHIGIDTVALKAKGFTVKVEEDQMVRAGDELIEFEMDYVAINAKSLLTQIILTNGEIVEGVEKAEGDAHSGETDLMTVSLKSEAVEEAETDGIETVSEAIIIPNITGLHARPAAVLAGLAKKFTAAEGGGEGQRQICGGHHETGCGPSG